jgi:hypothetical protein
MPGRLGSSNWELVVEIAQRWVDLWRYRNRLRVRGFKNLDIAPINGNVRLKSLQLDIVQVCS